MRIARKKIRPVAMTIDHYEPAICAGLFSVRVSGKKFLKWSEDSMSIRVDIEE